MVAIELVRRWVLMTADSSIAEVLVTEDSSIAEVLVPVERRRELVARTPGLEPHTHTDTGHSNTVADSSTCTDDNSREEDKLDQFQCRWGFQSRCELRLLPGPKTMPMRQWSGQHQRSKRFSPSWQLLLHKSLSTQHTFHYVSPRN
jgi:hypothetical protein